eukprot:4078649-Amphidinium_carterae.1
MHVVSYTLSSVRREASVCLCAVVVAQAQHAPPPAAAPAAAPPMAAPAAGGLALVSSMFCRHHPMETRIASQSVVPRP